MTLQIRFLSGDLLLTKHINNLISQNGKIAVESGAFHGRARFSFDSNLTQKEVDAVWERIRKSDKSGIFTWEYFAENLDDLDWLSGYATKEDLINEIAEKAAEIASKKVMGKIERDLR